MLPRMRRTTVCEQSLADAGRLWEFRVQAHPVSLRFTAHFLQTDGPWQPRVKQVYSHHFPSSIGSLRDSVSHSGNPRNISNIFIIITCELLQSHDKAWEDEALLLKDEDREWLLEMDSAAEDAVEIAEVTTKGLEYYMSLVGKSVEGFERIDSNCERSSTVGKMFSVLTQKSFTKGRVNQWGKLRCCLILRNCHSHLSLQQPPPWTVSHHQHQGKTLHWQEDDTLLETQMMFSIFSN